VVVVPVTGVGAVPVTGVGVGAGAGWALDIRYWVKIMNKVTIVSFVGEFFCLGLALIPIPFQQSIGLRQAGSVGTVIFGFVGWHESQRIKEQQEEFEIWQFEQQQKQRAIDAAVSDAVADVLVQEIVVKEQLRAQASVEVYKAETQQNFVTVMAHNHPTVLQQLTKPQIEPQPETETETETKIETIETKPETEQKPETEEERIKKAKAILMKLIEEHEGGWIGQLMKKPILIYGDQGSFKSYFAAFLALCRHYLRGHEIVSIADPHFHQNKDECWEYLVKLGVPGYGANYDYEAIGGQLNAMYDRFKTRTLKDTPVTSIFDEATNYGLEEGSMEAASKLGRKIVSDPRKSNESPIVIAHNNTNAAWGGSSGFSESLHGNVIQIKLLSTSEQTPVFRGSISGIKDEDGEFIKDFKISILPDWIRPCFVYNLFNPIPNKSPISPTPNKETNRSNKEYFVNQAQNWLADVNGSVSGEVPKMVGEAEVSFTIGNEVVSEVGKVTSEVPEIRNIKTSSFTLLLSEEERSKALVAVLQLLSEAQISSQEVISLMPENPDRALWLGIKLLNKSMTAVIRDVFDCGTGGKKFQLGKTWYEGLKLQFENYK